MVRIILLVYHVFLTLNRKKRVTLHARVKLPHERLRVFSQMDQLVRERFLNGLHRIITRFLYAHL